MTATPTRSSTTKKSTKNALVPRLRFPEFEGEWDVRSLSDLFGKITNGKANAQDHVSHGKYPLFDRSTEIKKSNKFEYEGRAVIIPGEGMRFQPRYFEGKFDLHQRTYALLESRESILFLFYGIAHRKTALSEKAVQSTVRSLRLPIVRKFKIPLPTLPEQQKIADCLSSLDDLIAAEAEKLETLKVHKKGLMQELFPREGETTPRIRFPEFEGEWDKQTLDYLCEIFSGGTPSTTNEAYWNGEIQWITPMEMGKSTNPYIQSTQRTLTEDGLKNCSSPLLPINAVILSTRAPIGHLARNSVPMAMNQGCRALVSKGKADNTFIYFILDHVKQLLENLGSGNTFKELSKKDLSSFSIPIPTLPEQQKIASVLSSLDDRITAQSERIELLKNHKKGLMQQLFPVMEG